LVSIPQWYDYYIYLCGIYIVYYGVSIPQWYDYYRDPAFFSANALTVSIPQWYDYYNVRVFVIHPNQVFQFLNGTIITPNVYELFECDNVVSIPQWYDYYYWMLTRRRQKPQVSIPQWYDYYYIASSDITPITTFQFLNGTIITFSALRAMPACMGFNSSMVRLLL